MPNRPRSRIGLGHLELARVAALEADAGLDLGLLHGLVHRPQFLEREAERLFENEMFARPGGAHGLVQPLGGKAAQRDDMDVRVGEHLVQVVIDADRAAVLGAERRRIQFARGANRRDLAERGGVDGGDVRRCHPAITDDADVVLFHGAEAGLPCAFAMASMAQPFARLCQPKPALERAGCPDARCRTVKRQTCGPRDA